MHYISNCGGIVIIIRKPAVAGSFYPDSAQLLDQTLSALLSSAKKIKGESRKVKAIIAPHAGFQYSGPVAATIYSFIESKKEEIRRVVLLGPAHYTPFKGLALSGADMFATPLGKIPVDKPLLQKLESLSTVKIINEAHQREHSLEVQLPFLQKIFSEFTIVPILTGSVASGEVEEVLEKLNDGSDLLFIISSDLSHYLSYKEASNRDKITSGAIEKLEPTLIGDKDACGSRAISALLGVARKWSLKARTIDLRNSGDTSGSRDRVVGYGAFSFEEN